ncbi:hypothetical protein GCM10027592_24720 [Spirosoma flavus]
MTPSLPNQDDKLDAFDERIESVTDELVSTELLHEAAILAGNILPDVSLDNRVN